MKAILLARVSTREQAEEGYSLASQVKLLKEYAEKKKIQIVKEFIIPESASGRQRRKKFDELMGFLGKNKSIKNLLCEKVDRLTRNPHDAYRIDQWRQSDEERNVHFVKQNLTLNKNSKSNEILQWDVYVAIARNTSSNISEEAKKGLYQKAEDGWYPGTHKRGYKLIYEGKRKVWQIDNSTNEPKYIKRLFELYDTGEYSTHSVGDVLFKDGWKDKLGKKMGKSTIHKLLRDCFYCGEFDWRGQHHTYALHEPIVSKQLFYRVQKRIDRKQIYKFSKHDFIYKKIISCGECGRTVTGEAHKGHHYYQCTAYDRICKQRKSMREEVLEEQVVNILESFKFTNQSILEWIYSTLEKELKADNKYKDEAIQEHTRQLTLIQTRMDEMYNDKLDGIITKEFYVTKVKEFIQKKEAIERDLEDLKSKNPENTLDLKNIFELAQNVSTIYKNIEDTADKRNMLRNVFSNLYLKDEKVIPELKKGYALVQKCASCPTVQGR